jgi:hypothetical protein
MPLGTVSGIVIGSASGNSGLFIGVDDVHKTISIMVEVTIKHKIGANAKRIVLEQERPVLPARCTVRTVNNKGEEGQYHALANPTEGFSYSL